VRRAWRPNVSILISGPSRTGKTTTANRIANRYGLETIRIGEEFRKLTGIDTSNFAPRESSLDQRMDDFQASKIRSATADEPFILEGRLAAFLASRERLANAKLPVVTVLLWAPEEERMARQLRKLRRENPRTAATLEKLLAGEREREARDLALWKSVHPELDDRNIFDPNLTDETGTPVYDLVVDTRVGTPARVAQVVHDWLVRRGAFKGRDG
jgi:cytidylate kinase